MKFQFFGVQHNLLKSQKSRVLLKVTAIIGVFEVLIMAGFQYFPVSDPVIETAIDASLLSLFSGFAIYWWVLAPQVKNLDHALKVASTIIDSMVEGVVVQDRSGKIVEFNSAALEILGIGREQALGRDSMDPRWKAIREDGSEFLGHDHPAMVALKSGVVQSGIRMGLELPTGQKKWIQINASPQFSGGEKIASRVVTTFVDITEKLNAEENSKRQEQLFAIATDAMKCGIWELDLEKKTMTGDANLCQILGLGPLEMLSFQDQFIKMILPAHRGRFAQRLEETLNKRKDSFKVDLSITTFDGEIKHLEMAAHCFYDQEHEGSIHLIGALIDLTEQRKAQLELQQTLSAINECAIVSMTDAYGKILMVNDNFCKVSGYESRELVGQSHRLVSSGAHSREFFKNMWTSALNGISWSGEIQNKNKRGQPYWLQSVITPILDLTGKVDRLISISFDLTEMRATQHQLMQSAKMASLGEMAGGIAHEINNPLAIIQAKATGLRKKISVESIDRTKILEDIGKIEKTVDRVAKIIRGLKSFSRNADNDSMQVYSVRQILEETLELCQEKFRNSQVELRVHCDSDFLIQCRSAQIEQIVMNLLGNAFDAVEKKPERWVEISVQESKGRVRLIFTDSGLGIPSAVVQKLMQPFFTTKEVGKGTGLGLSISKGIAEDHGGQLFYDSESVHTRFVLELPIFETKQISTEAA